MAGSSLRVRLSLLAVSSLLSALAVAAVLRARNSPKDTVSAHAIDPTKLVTIEPIDETVQIRPARPVTAEEVASFFQKIGPHSETDALAYFRYKPNLDLTAKFPEHPDGVTRMRTNSLGFKGVMEVRKRHPALRVIMTGDSHIDGVVGLGETCAERLQVALNAARPKFKAEVLNAAVGGYQLHNYFGALERCLPLSPDVFITCVFGGNDFDGSLFIHNRYGQRGFPPSINKLSEELERAAKACPGVRWQGLGAAYYFHRFPEQAAVAFDAVVSVTRAIRGKCAEFGIVPLFVYVPPMNDVQWWSREEELEAACRELGVSRAELAGTDAIAQRWIDWMTSEGVAHLDLRPEFRATKETLYWRADGHINVRAHAMIGEALEPIVRALHPRRSKAMGQSSGAFEPHLPPQPRAKPTGVEASASVSAR